MLRPLVLEAVSDATAPAPVTISVSETPMGAATSLRPTGATLVAMPSDASDTSADETSAAVAASGCGRVCMSRVRTGCFYFGMTIYTVAYLVAVGLALSVFVGFIVKKVDASSCDWWQGCAAVGALYLCGAVIVLTCIILACICDCRQRVYFSTSAVLV